MKKNCGLREERNTTTIMEALKNKLLLNAFAEGESTPEDTSSKADEPTEDDTPTTPRVNYEDLIAKARKEEKDKLYPKIDSLTKEKDALVEKHNNALLKIGTLEEEITSLKEKLTKEGKDDSEIVKELKAQLEKANKDLEGIQSTLVDENTIRESVRQELEAEYEVKLYREQKLREVGNEIIPELVTGLTKEEIDATLEASKTRYNEIVGRVTPTQPTNSMGNIPASNPNSARINNQDINISDLAKLDPRSPEYAEVRAKLGLK